MLGPTSGSLTSRSNTPILTRSRHSSRSDRKRSGLIKSCIVFIGLVGLGHIVEISCEAREIDWSELGVSLGPKSNIGTSGGNLRILVSPQRRMTKSYDLEYTNGTQANSGESSHVLAGSAGSYQPSGQISPTIAGPSHSSAYSALSASIASLRSRLNARGVNLTPMGDNYTQTSYYSNAPSAYGSYSEAGSPSQPIQIPSSPTSYVSVSSHHDSTSGQPSYVSSSGQTSDNKTIVLAIPAKINFLSDSRSPSVIKQSGPQAQAQQVTIIQPTSDNASPAEYSGKQYSGLINGQDAVIEQPSLPGRDNGGSEHEQQQYVIVNSPPASSEHQQLVAGIQGGSSLYAPSGQIYSQIGTSQSLKYLPTFSSGGQPIVQKAPAAMEQSSYYDQGELSQARSCPETCNISDSKWRRYSYSKYRYCCLRSIQYDSPYEQPSSDRANDKAIDDGYYSYLYRRSRSRKSKKSKKPSRYQTNGSEDSTSSDAPKLPRSYQSESPYIRYYKNRHQSSDSSESSVDDQNARSNKYQTRERSYRKSRSRELEPSNGAAQGESTEDEQGELAARPQSSSGYGSGEYSVEAGRYPQDQRAQSEEEDTRVGGDESYDVESKSEDFAPDTAEGQGEDMSELEPMTNKYSGSARSRRKSNKGRSKKNGKDRSNKKSRKAKSYKQDTASQTNGTDYEATAPGDSYHHEHHASGEEEQTQNNQRESTPESNYNSEPEPKSKSNSTDNSVINLSKTTMHLKEILSILEKKAQLRANETSSERQTSTPSPMTTTPSNLYSMSLFGSQYSSMLPSDLLTSDLGLKNPYRLDPTSLTSSLNSPSLSSISSALSSLANADSFSPLASYSSGHYSLPSSKPYGIQSVPQRKRRPTKAIRYNNLASMPKPHGLSIAPPLLHSPQAKNILNSGYYSSFAYPYWYPRLHPSVTNSYPYRNLHKNPYSSLISSPPKLPSSGLYGDERGHSMSGYDPIVSVASSLRPPTTMRLRSKPFMLPPHVMPMYARHSLLSPSLDVKK